MKANCWYGRRKLSVEEVPEPTILNSRDAVVRVSLTAICGSDLHLYNGYVPSMMAGDILGHEFMGEIVEVGPALTDRKVGDRVVVCFPISCGRCFFCKEELYSLCENTNLNPALASTLWGNTPCGIFGYSHAVGGYAGGQAQYVRVPFADVNTLRVPEGLTDEQVLFLSDVFPTGWMAAEVCGIRPGDTVAVWGCGPVGLFAIKSAFMLGASRVVAIDRFEPRLRMAREQCGAETLDYEKVAVHSTLMEMTGGRGPDHCIDAVGMEAHAPGIYYGYDRLKQALMLETDRPFALREALLCCRNGGTVSVPGVYGGYIDKIPFGSIVNRSLTIKSGQTHVQRYWKDLLGRIERGEIDPSFIITHHLPLEEAPQGFDMFLNKRDDCVKVVLHAF